MASENTCEPFEEICGKLNVILQVMEFPGTLGDFQEDFQVYVTLETEGLRVS